MSKRIAMHGIFAAALAAIVATAPALAQSYETVPSTRDTPAPTPPAAGEFPDEWYFYGSARPKALRALEGKPAPPLHLKDWIGEPVTLESLRGRIVVVDFWGTWCHACIKALPKNIELYSRHRDRGVVFLGIHDSARGVDRMPAIARDRGLTYPLAVDDGGKSAAAWKVPFWPTYAVLDRDGIVRAIGLNPERISAVIDRLLGDAPPVLAGQPVPPEIAPQPGVIPDAWFEQAPKGRDRLAQLLAMPAAPELTVGEWRNGPPLRLAALKGKVILLDFWGVWCSPCRLSVPRINEWHERYAADGLVVIGICHMRQVEKMAETVEAWGIRYPVCADPRNDTVAAYAVDGYPDFYLIDRSGRVRIADCHNEAVEDAIRSLLAEPPPP